jgi:hypothetical protein
MKYVNDPGYLKVTMVSFHQDIKVMQLAVFSILKIFVPNPYKGDVITSILVANKRAFF